MRNPLPNPCPTGEGLVKTLRVLGCKLLAVTMISSYKLKV